MQGSIHIDFLLPLDADTRADFAMLALPAGTAWLQVGDYGDLRAGTILPVATGDSAVMRFQPVGIFAPPLSITLDRLQYRRLRAVILSDTLWDQPVGQDLLASGDRFFAAKGRFDLLNPCNRWIASALRRAGRSFALWTPTNWSIRQALHRFAPGI